MNTIRVREDLEMRPLSIEHAAAMFHTIDQYRESLRTWLPFVDFTKQKEDSLQFIDFVNGSKEEKIYAICYRNQFTGLIGFREIDYANAKAEIGYWLSPAFQGLGLMTDCMKSLIAYAFTKMGMNRLQLRIAVKNERSLRIAQKLGFTHEGVERDGELLLSGYADLNVFSLLKKETDWK